MKRLAIGQFVVDWVSERVQGDFGRAHGIGLQRLMTGPYAQPQFGAPWKMVAGVAYEDYNGPNVVCHIAAEGANWMTRQFLWTIFDYPFNQMKVDRITVCVGEANMASRRFVAHLGVTLEANLRGAHPTGDLLVWRMFREDCKWISHDTCKRDAKAA